MNWTNDKPVFTEDCELVTATFFKMGGWRYELWHIMQGDGYMMWLNSNGEEFGDINDLKADKYLILPKHE